LSIFVAFLPLIFVAHWAAVGIGFIIANWGYRTLFMVGAMAGLLGAAIVWRLFPQDKEVWVPPIL
jgi:hypothetical protein